MQSPDTFRASLSDLLGGWPAGQPPSTHDRLPIGEPLGHATVHRLTLRPTRRTPCDDDAGLPALFVRPSGPGPFPAVLYCHAHGHDYALGKRELITGRGSLPTGPYGPALAARGIASLCIDQPAFGDRGQPSESSLAKRFAWHGDTLFGSMLRELAAALDWLCTQQDIDRTRIATLGLSMGCTTAWWLAALDERVRAVAGLCCLADMRALVDAGAHDQHAHFLTVPGLLGFCNTADIAALIAPRPHLVAIGERDPLTPPDAVAAVLEPLARRYAGLNASEALEIVREPDGGHQESPTMRAAVLAFLDRHLLAVARTTARQPA